MKHILYILLLLLAMASIAHADTPDTNIINIYDANGNLVTGDGNYYEYNDANQLVRVRQGDANGAVIAEYFYDYSGQRIKKIENGVTTYYIGKHFEKQVGGTDEGNASYYFAEGERVARKDPSGNIYFYHSDHLGGTNAVTDSAGTVVAKTDYLPFGEVKQGSTGNEKYSYTGKEKDKTDLYYFEARYNSPMFKHFTQADVASPDLSDPQDLNRYSYVRNNPMSYVDPDGFKKKKKSKKKKKAKLSKREKFMIAHGVDPDKDKTSLKEAKTKFENSSKQASQASIKSSSATITVSSNKICTDFSCDIDPPEEGVSQAEKIESAQWEKQQNMSQEELSTLYYEKTGETPNKKKNKTLKKVVKAVKIAKWVIDPAGKIRSYVCKKTVDIAQDQETDISDPWLDVISEFVPLGGCFMSAPSAQ